MSNSVSVIMYHYVRNLSNSRYPNIKGLNIHEFIQQIEFLKKTYNFVSVEQLLNALNNNEDLPEKAVLLTFDDGYIDHYTYVFPILYKEKIPAYFSMPGKIIAEHKLLDVNKIHFILASTPIEKLKNIIFERLDYYRGLENMIPPNQELYQKLAVANRFDCADVIFIKRLLQVELEERLRNLITDDLFSACITLKEEVFAEELYMNIDQINVMSREGMYFGIHGYDHYWMNRLTLKELENDIKLALETFNGVVDPQKWICCYPYGSYSDAVIDFIKTQGAVAGFTTHNALADLSKYDPYRIPRFDTNDFPPKSQNFNNEIL